MKLTLTLYGAPRTAKNSPMLIRGIKHPVLIPSEAYREWTRLVLDQKPLVDRLFGSNIPIQKPVSIKATFYREANTGDHVGYLQALGDVIQADVWQCARPANFPPKCNKKTVGQSSGRCRFCEWPALKKKRSGLGLVLDDRQIQHWDGSRLHVDRLKPRVELLIETIEAQADMFDPDEEAEDDAD